MSKRAFRFVTIAKRIVDGIRGATSGPELHRFLQSAVELEHAIIPPYLTALYSIKPGTNLEVAGILRSIMVQEMLHMTIAANVLNAIGGAPILTGPGFVPTYPGPLPMGVDEWLTVPLEPLSLTLIEHVFMRIELPETPDNNPGLLTAPEHGFATIGEFYDAIMGRLLFLGDAVFTGDPARQVVDPDWFPADQLFPVTDPETAYRALEIIRHQGEGASSSPFDGAGQPAHYYRFEEILHGRLLVEDPAAPIGYSFSGAPVPFDPDGIIDIVANGTPADYQPGTPARNAVDEADAAYGALLALLHRVYNGEPELVRPAREQMRAFGRMVAERVVTQRIPGGPHAGKYAAPTFRIGMGR
jgi:hypothetical protein